MHPPEPLAPAIQEFFDREMPADGGNHTLALDEWHTRYKHLAFLEKNLDHLKTHHGLTTIGIEADAFMNVFLWAYADGILDKRLGSHKAAREYVCDIWEKYEKSVQQDHAIATADLMLTAMDKGIHVVAFDSRDTFLQREKRAGIRLSPGIDSEKLSIGAQVAIAIANSPRSAGRPARVQDDGGNLPSLLFETQWVKSLDTRYEQQLQTLEQLVRVGHHKINEGKLSSDALSAVIFDALSLPGNRITISGSDHNNGVGEKKSDAVHSIHGTFAQHLFAVGKERQGHTVTHAAIACTAMGEAIYEDRAARVAKQNVMIADNAPLPLVNIETNQVKIIAPAPEDKTIPLAARFQIKTPLFGKPPTSAEVDDFKAAHINPLLMPEIAQAVDAVRSMFGTKTQGKGR